MTNRNNTFVATLVFILISAGATASISFTSVSGQEGDDDEIPGFGEFGNMTPALIPRPEAERVEPAIPENATSITQLREELPSEDFVKPKDADSSPLSITNATEILQILPANSTKIIKFIDEDLRNNTGVGLLPKDLLENLSSQIKANTTSTTSTTNTMNTTGNQSIPTLLSMIPAQDLKEINASAISEDSDSLSEEPSTSETPAVNLSDTEKTPSPPSEEESNKSTQNVSDTEKTPSPPSEEESNKSTQNVSDTENITTPSEKIKTDKSDLNLGNIEVPSPPSKKSSQKIPLLNLNDSEVSTRAGEGEDAVPPILEKFFSKGGEQISKRMNKTETSTQSSTEDDESSSSDVPPALKKLLSKNQEENPKLQRFLNKTARQELLNQTEDLGIFNKSKLKERFSSLD